MKSSRILSLALCFMLTGLLFACTTPKQPPLPVGSLRLGVAQYTQPSVPAEMLAGYMASNTPRVGPTLLHSLDTQLATMLAKHSKNRFVGADSARQCYETIAQENEVTKQAGLRTWAMVGRCMQVDLLLVPQVIFWQEREGSAYGAVLPAGVSMDMFIIDVNGENLLSRSHFEELQAPLNQNLLHAGKFIRRAGQWVPANELAKEAMKQGIKELGI